LGDKGALLATVKLLVDFGLGNPAAAVVGEPDADAAEIPATVRESDELREDFGANSFTILRSLGERKESFDVAEQDLLLLGSDDQPRFAA
jgi:hypothetical protein